MTHKFKPGPAKLVNGMTAKTHEVMDDGRIFGAYYHDCQDQWIGKHWHPGGRLFVETKGIFDLVPPEPGRPSGWVNVYRRKDGSGQSIGSVAETEAQADKWSDSYERAWCHANQSRRVRTHCIDLSDPALDKFRVGEEGKS